MSVADETTTADLIAKHDLTFPVGYSASTDRTTESEGDIMDEYVPGLLPADESLDDEELGDDVDGPGYSPLDRPIGSRAWGVTAYEASTHEPISQRLAREVPDITSEEVGDGIGDTSDTSGEPINNQVGYVRAGRLAWATQDADDPSSDLRAEDVGIDGAGASAEEAAIHIVPDDPFDV